MSPITRSKVETIVARVDASASAKNLNYKLTPFSLDKCGILGQHYLLSVKFKDEPDKNANNRVKSCNFFVKLLGDRSNLPPFFDEYIFEEEINFYNQIQPLMLEDYKGEKWSADCYLAENDVLALEDLRERGFIMRKEQTMNENALKSATATLARFHACSLLAEVKIGKPLNEEFPGFFTEKIYNKCNNFGKIVQMGYKTQILMAEKLDLDANFVLPAVYDYISRMVRPQKGELNVICHSDLSKYNIMFNADNTSAVILDYQLLRYASPVIDISTLLHLNTTPEFRKASDSFILKHYYSVFEETLKQNESTIEIPSYEDMLENYHKRKIVGMAFAVDYLASIYLDDDFGFKIRNDPEVQERFLIHNRIDILGYKLETDRDYANKMKKILCEYLDEGKRILKL